MRFLDSIFNKLAFNVLNKLALTKARLLNWYSWGGSRRHFDIIPEIASYASQGTCDSWQVFFPLYLADLQVSPSSHLPQIDHLPYSFLKSDAINFFSHFSFF